MNITQAKDYIKDSINIYLKKDEFGDYRIPVVRQRPIFLLGAPGIGKTAIMEQIAEELGVALVSYSMTHHTRQSALGLPFIKVKQYEDTNYDISEYTMSEIIATIYETMEQSGVKEGILFLDEINCVSETLAPSMLQFLQYKVFGKHKVPDGWIIVTAGNPPEYNKSVREFDVVTLDRLKVIEVEPEYQTWKEYGTEKGIHNVILTFLEIKKEFFYHMETTSKGRSYVTARGWEDLSEIITMYEEDGLKVDETLVSQYIRNELIVKEFCAYYDLYNKYKNDYKVDEILDGKASDTAISKAKSADFDERLSLLGMLSDKLISRMKEVVRFSDYLNELMSALEAVKVSKDVYKGVDEQISKRKDLLIKLDKANALSASKKKKLKKVVAYLEDTKKGLAAETFANDEEAFRFIKKAFALEVEQMKGKAEKTTNNMHNMFEYVNAAFEGGNEMLIFVTELTVNKYSSKFISMFGSADYHKYNKLLMVSERQDEMKKDIEKLVLSE